ncbi:MAG: TIGR02556 family CRISPR-associated protein [Dehalococcoidales bacterium]|nr:TIGR02556 family CRISPR-associated protein [Dehalococcoidales bacterium]
MLEALRTLGVLLGGPSVHDPIQATYVAVLDFDAHGRYLGRIHIEEFSQKKVPLYLYKKAKGSNPPTLTPSLVLNRNQIEKSLKNARNAYRKLRPFGPSLPTLDLEDEELWPTMARDLAHAIEGTRKRDRVLLTVRVNGRWMGEREDFRRALLAKFREEGRESLVVGRCAICGEEKEVSGDISPFKFYTIDKPGYVVDGFNKAKAYKAFPLCYDCRDLIQRGRQHVEESLTFSFAPRIRYLLIPDFLFGKEAVRQEVLDILTEEREQRHKRLHTLSRREIRRITTDEGDILDLLSEERDVMTFHFLFMTRQQGREAIELYIQDVYPSRLRTLFTAKEAVDRALRFPWGDGTWREYDFTYATLYRFFSKADPSKQNPDLLRHFYDLVDRTFRAAAVPETYLIPFLMRQIRHDVVTPDRRDQGQYRFTIQDALATLMFVQLTTRREVFMPDRTPATLEEFLDSLPTLNSDLKKGLFLLGSLTERLLRVQGQERGSAPFWKSLKSLKMNATDLQGLLPKVRNKLEEYDRFGPGERSLFERASVYLARESTPWRLSVDELNFYFALGMGHFPRIAMYLYPQQKEGEA